MHGAGIKKFHIILVPRIWNFFPPKDFYGQDKTLEGFLWDSHLGIPVSGTHLGLSGNGFDANGV